MTMPEKWLVTLEVIRQDNEKAPADWDWQNMVDGDAKAVHQRFVERVDDDV